MFNHIKYCTKPGKLVFDFTIVKFPKTSAVIRGKNVKFNAANFTAFHRKRYLKFFCVMSC